jgi:glutathione S-transferase
MDALVEYLGDQPYFGGDSPVVLDCIAFAFLDNILNFPIPSLGIREYGLSKPTLAAYLQRIRTKFFEE